MSSPTGQQTREEPDPERRAALEIVGAVTELLEAGGYGAVTMRAVARRARVSLATVYRLFPTQSNGLRTPDELVVTAIEHWMSEHAYSEVLPRAADETLYDALMRMLRYVFEPWERSPRMLEVFHRVREGPAGDRVRSQGWNAVAPIAYGGLSDLDAVYVHDINLVITNLVDAVIAKFAQGRLEITDILPTLERAVFRLTANNEPSASVTHEVAESDAPNGGRSD